MEISGLKASNDTSVLDIRQLGTKSVSTLAIRKDKSECYKFIMVVILGASNFFGSSWNNDQRVEITEDFYEKFHYWKAADFKLFYFRCKTLYYGKVYGSFSPALLMEWAKLYDDEWMETSERLAENKSQQHKRQEENTEIKLSRDKAEGSNYLSSLYNKIQSNKPYSPNINDKNS